MAPTKRVSRRVTKVSAPVEPTVPEPPPSPSRSRSVASDSYSDSPSNSRSPSPGNSESEFEDADDNPQETTEMAVSNIPTRKRHIHTAGEANSPHKRRIVAKSIRRNNQKGKAGPSKRVKRQTNSTKIRVSPSLFASVISQLKTEQKQWVESTGLSIFLQFRLESLPHKLGFLLAESLNGLRIELSCGTITVTEQDVQQVLGLPRGVHELDMLYDNESEHMAWALPYGLPASTRYQISGQDVADHLVSTQVLDEDFKRNFVVLFYNTFIETSRSSYIEKRVLNAELDYNNLSKHNWCKRVIEVLEYCKVSWNPSSNFTGPLVFLVLLYADRVVTGPKRDVPRLSPTWLSWTHSKLKTRAINEIAKNKFGTGLLFAGMWEASTGKQNEDGVAPPLHAPSPSSHPTHTATTEELYEADTEQLVSRLLGCMAEYNGRIRTIHSISAFRPRMLQLDALVREAMESLATVEKLDAEIRGGTNVGTPPCGVECVGHEENDAERTNPDTNVGGARSASLVESSPKHPHDGAHHANEVTPVPVSSNIKVVYDKSGPSVQSPPKANKVVRRSNRLRK